MMMVVVVHRMYGETSGQRRVEKRKSNAQSRPEKSRKEEKEEEIK